ncbi:MULTISPECIES: hypothetical protein [Corallococcus]|uniref:hypothetical protein n=1 Tax=Corallococcus TaxID=83461 RepID=UPI00117DDFF3|nr:MULTISPECIES: hypothetical protein [Corallococcus]NBD08279.1 hypothetical protein [Corallococcus silvisoli]TSC34240.1 hypothetical protein FOF48_04180 [Corallococcus sp. Z5C101001]
MPAAADDAATNVSSALATVDNVAIKVEQALYKLYLAVSGDGFKSITEKISVIWTPVRNVLSSVLKQVEVLIKPLMDPKVVDSIKNVLEAGRDLVNSTLDLLPDSARSLAQTGQRFLNIIVDFVGAGVEHIVAIIDLLLNVGKALINEGARLADTTIAALKKSGVNVLAAG